MRFSRLSPSSCCLLALGLVPVTQAGEPTEQLRTDIGQVYKILQQPNASADAQREATAILDQMFDWRQMAESALRRHWAQRTPDEQARLHAALRRALSARLPLAHPRDRRLEVPVPRTIRSAVTRPP